MADQRVAIRKAGVMKGRHLLGFLVGVPLSAYIIKNGLASNGVMHNHKSGSGTYMHGVQNFMYPLKTITQTWRPELDIKEQAASLSDFTRRMESKRAAGEEVTGRVATNWL